MPPSAQERLTVAEHFEGIVNRLVQGEDPPQTWWPADRHAHIAAVLETSIELVRRADEAICHAQELCRETTRFRAERAHVSLAPVPRSS